MLYDTSARKNAKPSEQQALIPDKMREANQKIEGDMTRFQHSCAQLRQLKDEVGTATDGVQLRDKVSQKIKDMKKAEATLKTLIEEYSSISVPYKSQQ